MYVERESCKQARKPETRNANPTPPITPVKFMSFLPYEKLALILFCIITYNFFEFWKPSRQSILREIVIAVIIPGVGVGLGGGGWR